MTIIEKLIWIVICHIVGDYLLQTDYMAREKGKDWYILFAHCVCYILPFALIFGISYILLIIFVVHFITDSLKARYKKIGIVADQIIHYLVALLLLVC